MKEESTIYKIWQVVYPLLLYFLLDLLMVWAIEYLISPRTPDGSMVFEGYSSAVASIIFLAVSIGVMYYFYQRDYHLKSDWIYRNRGYFAIIVVTGMLASHGLSALVSLLKIDQIAGNYTEIEQAVFSAPWFLVVIQIVILTPISEELIFRGLLYKRLERYTGSFWIAALISSAIFGVAHWNLAQGVFAFLFGLLSCAVYDSIQNLWACIALHFGGNLLSVIFVFTGFDYPEVRMCAAGMAAALVVAFILYYFCIRKVKERTMKEMG